MTWSVRLTKPPNDIVTTTISSLTQEQVGQIDDLWEGILQETQQPDADWNWNYKLRLAVNDDRYEVYGIELEALLQGVILLETQRNGWRLGSSGAVLRRFTSKPSNVCTGTWSS